MRRRRILLICLAVALLLAAAVPFLPSEPEPSYQGRSLSAWLEEYLKESDGPFDIDTRTAAFHAIEALGAEAVPWLLNWLQYETPAWRADLIKSVAHASSPLAKALDKREETKRQKAYASALAFDALRAQAGLVAPRLRAIFTNGTPGSANAAIALLYFPPKTNSPAN